ncbi:nuclear body protein SP140-like protein [Clarias gariepinus]|uniref:nuclear body protein SP140-like n=1 Tax=Clarias gariepinus TaxID=13013 RepID=UPI00234D73F0|nr:nuclear body protein SP140-like [Clarias gariepinus]
MKSASGSNVNSSQKMKRQSSGRSNLRKRVTFSSHVLHKKRLTSIPTVLKQQGENIKKRPKLPVTCGDKKGILHKNRFNKGEPCIWTDRRWLTPTQFEKFGGKKKNKSWKMSICHNKFQLQMLIQKGFLSSPSFRAKRSKDIKLVSGVEMAESTKQFEEKENEDMEQDEDDNYDKEEEKEDKNEDNGKGVDLSTFDPPALPVSCGSVSGSLYKIRFAGAHRKSIRTEERWFTPEEFIKQELTFTDRNWMESILCHGKTLNYLVKRKQENDDECYICKIDEKLLYCNTCPRAFHRNCHLPTLRENTPRGAWTCTFCKFKSKQRFWNHMSRKDALSSPVSGDTILRCEYLLLHLCKVDTSRVFAQDPHKRVPGYSSVISNPMWLDKVKNKLQENKYRKVEQFVNDIELIFNNWKTFNWDNMYGWFGTKMKNMLEEEFNTIFKIQ